MSTERILLVEDEEAVAEFTERSLRVLGYEVTSRVDSGEQAIRRALTEKPDLILMDIALQGQMDGVEAARRISAGLDLPVVFMTALRDDGTFLRASSVEPFGFILKPFDLAQLRSAIEIAGRQYKSSRARAQQAAIETAAQCRADFKDALVGVFRTGIRGDLMQASHPLLRVLGSDLLTELLSRVQREDGTPILGSEAQSGPSGQVKLPESFKLQTYTRDGRTIWVSGSVRLVRDAVGKAMYYEGSVTET